MNQRRSITICFVFIFLKLFRVSRGLKRWLGFDVIKKEKKKKRWLGFEVVLSTLGVPGN